MSKNKVMVMVAPNGARKTKADHPSIPITVLEVAADAQACVTKGAAAVHVHVRDRDERHVLDAALYADLTQALRESVPGCILQITTEGGGYIHAARTDGLRAGGKA